MSALAGAHTAATQSFASANIHLRTIIARAENIGHLPGGSVFAPLAPWHLAHQASVHGSASDKPAGSAAGTAPQETVVCIKSLKDPIARARHAYHRQDQGDWCGSAARVSFQRFAGTAPALPPRAEAEMARTQKNKATGV